jgi:hypothetical protein
VLAHVRLHIANCHYLPEVVIDPSSYASWEDTMDPTQFTPYSPVNIGPGYNDTMCIPAPYVMGWSPQCTNAGSFQEMTISGEHFGNDTGAVYFTSVDHPGGFVHTLPQDIRYWSDNTITLLIPSALSTDTLDPTIGTAASGVFFVRTSSGVDNSADSVPISISYAN